MKILQCSEACAPGFKADIEVSGCFCVWNQRILLLKRASHKLQGDTWGLPAGKLEVFEEPKVGAIRELHEETGLKLNADSLNSIGALYMQRSDCNVVFHMFHTELVSKPELNLLLEENVEASWVTLDEAFKLPLIVGGAEALSSYIRFLDRRSCSTS